MEKRAVIAVGLSVLVLLVYQYFFIPATPIQSPPAAVQANTPSPDPARISAVTPAQTAQLPAISNTDSAPERVITVQTDMYTARFSTMGGTLAGMTLKKFKNPDGTDLSILHPGGPYSALSIGSKEDFSISRMGFQSDAPDTVTLGQGNESATVVFQFSDGTRSVRRTYGFKQGAYTISIKDEVQGLPEYEITLGANLGINEISSDLHTGPVALIDTDRKEFEAKKIEAPEALAGAIKWIAIEDKYFFSALVPSSTISGARVWREKNEGAIALFGGQGIYEFTLYAGPKELDNLKKLNIGVEHIVDFGFFSIIARPIFWLLNRINDFVHNYGWSIILLTILIRIPFIPIVNKGQESMKRLQELQPRMAELKVKYAKDPQRMQAETMELYKKHKVNPMGGCLPMLLQIPVFFALYKVLLIAIELRGAPFAMWIHDLSMKDPYYVLPIVMGVSMVIQQKMTPQTGDSTQQKIMMFLPVIFTFMFLNFASGLVLYWLVNNILSIAQQVYVMRKKPA